MRDKDYLYDLLVHDLTGPLSVVATTVNSLLCRTEKYGALSESQKVALERIQRNAHRAQLLVREILEVARAEENLFEGDHFLVGVVVRECLQDVLDVINQAGAEKLCRVKDEEDTRDVLEGTGISVEITGKYRDLPFYHDRKKVEQILRNLMSNGLKYRRTRMSVSVSGDEDLVVSVEDDGPGIPEKEYEAVYKRFIQIRNGAIRDVPGLGLGLFCVKSLVEQMKGEIILVSREGHGTRFTVRIPSLQSNAQKEVTS